MLALPLTSSWSQNADWPVLSSRIDSSKGSWLSAAPSWARTIA
jgi:hypothetical protein